MIQIEVEHRKAGRILVRQQPHHMAHDRAARNVIVDVDEFCPDGRALGSGIGRGNRERQFIFHAVTHNPEDVRRSGRDRCLLYTSRCV